METVVRTAITFPGFHNWENCSIPEVEFLKSPHRHLFKVIVGVYVTSDDREVEFFVLQRDLRYTKGTFEHNSHGEVLFGSMSCEMIAKKFWLELELHYNLESVTVSEDGESEAEIRFALKSNSM